MLGAGPTGLLMYLIPIYNGLLVGMGTEGLCRKLGISRSVISGVKSFVPGQTAVGPAITLQYLPKREDQFPEGEYREPEKQLHRHARVLDFVAFRK